MPDPGATLKNNTIYQAAGNGVVVSDYSEGVTLRDNIVWVEQGVGISVAADSQIDFASDFNLLHATGTGGAGRAKAEQRSRAGRMLQRQRKRPFERRGRSVVRGCGRAPMASSPRPPAMEAMTISTFKVRPAKPRRFFAPVLALRAACRCFS
ncbi:MAG: right-handed parallel beta-helix repeat-containing protein [Pirellulaceae bacterium]